MYTLYMEVSKYPEVDGMNEEELDNVRSWLRYADQTLQLKERGPTDIYIKFSI